MNLLQSRWPHSPSVSTHTHTTHTLHRDNPQNCPNQPSPCSSLYHPLSSSSNGRYNSLPYTNGYCMLIHAQHPPLMTDTTHPPIGWDIQLTTGETVRRMTRYNPHLYNTTFTDLNPGTEYRVRVAGVNIRGSGTFSEYANAQTNGSATTQTNESKTAIRYIFITPCVTLTQLSAGKQVVAQEVE